MAVIEQYPYIGLDGEENYNLIKHYSDTGNLLVQLETGREYEEAVDNYPCEYTYAEIIEAEPVTMDEVEDPENVEEAADNINNNPTIMEWNN